ncbi:MAG: serine protease [Microcystis aeruginosa Ma_QC_Ca_00000000_S207]|uniref:Serine protease n=1 Tax=Microcystis aeruginosa Ma_QC_Ca_00000000_S207 TaxID=2486251 RepID=A0A552FKL4_MICAE|nr:MAG: serine protease [Microcystis aeruginosa Ma_QC_Ca_00000000_S207]
MIYLKVKFLPLNLNLMTTLVNKKSLKKRNIFHESKVKKMKYRAIYTIYLSILLWGILVGCEKDGTTPQQQEVNPSVISEILRKSTVYIKGIGTGIIIGSASNNYYVLTAKHVVDNPSSKEIVTYDRRFYPIQEIIPDRTLDLAIVKFTSEMDYPTVTLNRNISQGQAVSVLGWRYCSGKPKEELTLGTIEQIVRSDQEYTENDKKLLENLDDPKKHFQEGNRVKYTNPTIEGMSGAGVFNQHDQVVAIHATAGTYENSTENCSVLDSTHSPNWGIPIEVFLDSPLSRGIPIKTIKASPDQKENPSPQNIKEQSNEPIFKRPKSRN